MAVNNAWLMHRPHLWVGVDPPGKFADSGWHDPGILKFLPACHTGSRVWEPDGVGAFRETPSSTGTMPGCFYFVRNDGFDPATFLSESHVSWGTLKDTKDALGISNMRSVFLAALKLLHHLGFSRIYLMGCDFRMATDPTLPAYSFGEDKDKKGREGNNRLYQALDRRCRALAPYFEKGGFRVLNCTPHSSLTAFPSYSLERAIEEEGERCQRKVPEGGWYTLAVPGKKQGPKP